MKNHDAGGCLCGLRPSCTGKYSCIQSIDTAAKAIGLVESELRALIEATLIL